MRAIFRQRVNNCKSLLDVAPSSITDISNQPLFYQQRERLINAIPDVSEQSQLDSSALPILNNYLTHYGIQHLSSLEENVSPKPSSSTGNAIKSTSRDQTQNKNSHQIWKTTVEQFHIVGQHWKPTGVSKGTLIICHGYFDHTALYGRVIQWGLANHLTVVGFDLPGHGLSSGARAEINHFDQYTSVLTHILSKVLPTILFASTDQHTAMTNTTSPKAASNNHPIYLIGQSTGCSVIANGLLNEQYHTHWPVIQANILLAPLVRIRTWACLRYLYFSLRRFTSSVKRHFATSSHDEVFSYFLKHRDPLQARRVPTNWLGAMDMWAKQVANYASSTKTTSTPATTAVKTPVHIIQGTGDTTVDWSYNLPQLSSCFPNSHHHYIPKAKHHLVKESDFYWKQVEDHLQTIIGL